MADWFVRLFWLSIVGALPAAFFASGYLRWMAIGLVGAIGLLLALANWATLAIVVMKKRNSSSMVPPIGGLLLCIAIAAIPRPGIRGYAPLGLLFDPWLPAMGLALVVWIWRKMRRRAEDAR